MENITRKKVGERQITLLSALFFIKHKQDSALTGLKNFLVQVNYGHDACGNIQDSPSSLL